MRNFSLRLLAETTLLHSTQEEKAYTAMKTTCLLLSQISKISSSVFLPIMEINWLPSLVEITTI